MAPDSPSPPSLADGYSPPPLVYDELKDERAQLRPNWSTLVQQLDRLGREELERRWEKARHTLHDNGVSYNVYGDPQGMERPWSLSLVPVVISAEEWPSIELAISQRARLLDALLRDLYGAQRVLVEGLLPPELVYENPGFLRAVHNAHVPADAWLPLYAVDLVRLPTGKLAVLEDRTQAPSGAGYALENRIVISGVLPEVFRQCKVERLASFFRTLRDTLQWMAPHNRDNPRIVLLTPGPYNATYFEQAYLAQYLGYTLVNGGDLTVRADKVYLKTLGGLQPVDVILRRVNDDFCDPLELRPESVLGVPGICQAARTGNVALANPLGSGLLQTHALLPYLGRIAKALLGEELRMSAVRTFWCGDESARREAFASFDDVVVKRTFATGSNPPIFTAHLAQAERAELRARIEAEPRKYVVQEHVRGSTTPALIGEQLVPRALVMRCFSVLGRGGYVTMPGALSRVAGAEEGTEYSMQLGAGSKDTWVLSRGDVASFSLLPPVNRTLALSRGGGDLPSRVADNLYWLGRYAERAESVARLCRVLCVRLSDVAAQAELERSTEFIPLLRALTAQTDLVYTAPLDAPVELSLRSAERRVVNAVFGEGQGTLKVVLRSALRAGRLVRDRISTDTWRVLAALDDELTSAEQELDTNPLGRTLDVLHRLVLRLVAFSGLVMDGMSRGQAWRFLEMGRRLERAMTMVMLMRATLREGCEREGPLLEAVLEIADSSMTYRRRYLTSLQAAAVVDLLLTDETNPRSVLYQMEELHRHLEALPIAGRSELRTQEQRITLAVLTDLKLAEIGELCASPDGPERPRLELLLLDLATRIPALSDLLSARYLTHATVSRHLTHDDGGSEAEQASERRGLP